MSFLIIFLRRNIYLILAASILLTASYITNVFLGSNVSIKLVRNSIESFLQERETDFDHFAEDTNKVKRFSAQQYTRMDLDEMVEKKYGVLIYERKSDGLSTLTFWSDPQAVMADSLLKRANGRYFVRLSNGQHEFVKKEIRSTGGKTLILVALIPIRWQYYISTPNLKPEFVDFPAAENRVRISIGPTSFPVKNISGNVLFYLDKIESYNAAKYSWILLLMAFLGILLLLVVIHNLARAIADKFGSFAGASFLIVFVLILRALSYYFPSMLHLRQYELFDPTIYSSSFVLSSLGDLLINTLLFCWIILFIRQESSEFSLSDSSNTWKKWALAGSVLVILVITSFVFADIVQSLVADARISFNVTNFFTLNVYSFVGFIVLAALALSFFFFSQMLLRLILSLIGGNNLPIYIIISVAGLFLLSFVHKTRIVQLNILVLIWLLAYAWLMLRNLFSGLNVRLNVSEVLFWLFIFSISISTIIIFENHRIELDQRKQFANRLSRQMDPTSERLISMSLIYFDNEFLYQNFDRLRDPYSNQMIKDSLISSNFPAYNNEFDTKIYTYDSSEKPLHNEYPVSYDTLNTIFQLQGKTTGIQDLKYYEKSFDRFSYIYRKEIVSPRHKLTGYLFMLAEPKNFKGSGLVPELTQQRKEFLPEYLPMYFYAIYNNMDLIFHYKNYPFPTLLTQSQVPKRDFVLRKNGSYDELWQRISDGKVVVIAKKDNSLIEAITLFAYLFSAFLFLVALFWLISVLIQTRLHWRQIKTFLQLNIRSQIHATIIFVSLFSFVVIGVATIYFFINRYKRNSQDQMGHSIQIIVNEFQSKLPFLAKATDPYDLERLVSTSELEKLVNTLDEIHGTDVNLYNQEGDLVVSSNPFIYTKGILSMKMNPLAYYQMNLLHSVEYFNDEQMGRISFQSIYCPVRIGDGRACAYLNIPSFSTQDELKDEISKFLMTIIYLNVFIFLIAGTIALFLTNRITSSFRLISEKMRQINLGKTNEVIEWKSNDEIGGLVKEYNKMVEKLEESAATLAKSEREFAWREMARQVAHEIKNPLTPMKLSIQYLQKAIANNSVNVKELTANVANTLVEQIDHLSKIAADFSQFANIGNPKNEVFDLHDMLYSLTSLYETTENLLFKWVPVHQRIMVFADKTQLNRLFTNLLQNALEACVGHDKRVISVSEELDGESILVKVSDNGEGIPEAMKTKIFMPNFTTKSSGTGLGLAMSKTIVEQAKGKIWFETKEGEGTIFYVELPVLRVGSLESAVGSRG
jgi:two-component system, NtrC family, nitrogen regulation sensor histidine kinase NtrY